MRERRVVNLHRCRGVLAALVLSLALGISPASAAELYGLVVGVDDYVGTANDLDGAANDANDVAQAFNRLGARDVVRLVNGEASKDRIAAAWAELSARRRPATPSCSAMRATARRSRSRTDVTTRPTGSTRISCSGLSIARGRDARADRRRRAVRMDEAGRQEAHTRRARRRFLSLGRHGAERVSATGVSFRKRRLPAITDDQLDCRHRRNSPSSRRPTSTLSPLSAPSPRTN